MFKLSEVSAFQAIITGNLRTWMRNTCLFLSTCRAVFSFHSSSLTIAFIPRIVTATASNLYYSIHRHCSYFPFSASCHCYMSPILYQLTIHKHCQVKWSFLSIRLGGKKNTESPRQHFHNINIFWCCWQHRLLLLHQESFLSDKF